MSSSPPGPPGTPQRAFSEELSPLPPRNPMADADHSVKRKRPRLDSGERAHRSMSADPSLPALSSSELTKLQLHSNPASSDAAQPDPASLKPQIGTPSKVTLNLRDPALAVSPTLPPAADHGGMAASSSQHSPTPTHPPAIPEDRSSSPVPAAAAAAAAASPSPMGSPQIEIAEPEDIDGHDGPTVWMRPEDNFDLETFQNHEFSLFPFYKGGAAYQAAMEDILAHLKQHDSDTGSYLFLVSEWIDRHLEITSQQSRHWFELFTSAREFWDSLPLLMENFARRQVTICAEHVKVDEQGNENPANPVEALLKSFAALTARIANMDSSTLRETVEDTNVTPDLMGSRYLSVFSSLVARTDLPLLRTMGAYGWDVDAVMDSAIETFVTNLEGGIPSLTQQILLHFGRTPLDSEGIGAVLETIKIVSEHCAKTFIKRGNTESPPSLKSGTIQQGAWDCFKTVDEKLQESICKQNSSLNLDILRWIIGDLTAIFRVCVMHLEVPALEMIPESMGEDLDVISLEDLAVLKEFSWKMRLLKKCIVQGRMETRMLGVEHMQDLLVEAWNRFIKNKTVEGCRNPIVIYLSDFILTNKLVEYLVGVESHHQLVPRSKNIIGFLIVSGKYTQAETDILWKSITTSQDPRLTETVTEMARGLLDLSNHAILLGYCEKLAQLPPRAFDSRMRYFANSLTICLAKARGDSSDEESDMKVYLLYIRLIREVFIDTSLSTKTKREILSFAASELRTLLQWRLSDADRLSVFAQCFGYIAEGSPLASGSIATINILIDHNPIQSQKVQLEELESRFQMTELLVADLSRLAQIEAATKVSVQELTEILTDRLVLMQRIIVDLPESLTPQSINTLWTSLVGEKALSPLCRDIAWSHLSKAVSICRSIPNSFVDACIHEHFPHLEREYFTALMLQFACAATDYEYRRTKLQASERGDSNEAGQGDLLWPIALKADSAELGSKAVETLVNNQLNGKHVRSLSMPGVVEYHARFINSGIEQLISAANDLKKLNDETSSGEEDSMVIVASEKDVAAAKLRFIRSLAILNKFMHGVRSNRALSPVIDANDGQSPQSLEGEEVVIRWQPHVGGKSPGIFTLKIGSLAPFEDLIAKIKKRTGFSEFNMIAGGQRIDIAANQGALIGDLKALRTGLLLIQKIPGSQVDNVTSALTRLSPLENEVMKHFSALYELLGIDGDLGREVFVFLSTFQPHADVISLVSNPVEPAHSIFPPDAAYKSMYSIHALSTVLIQRLSEGAPCLDLISHGVRVLSAAILALDLPQNAPIEANMIMLAKAFVDCLLKFLKADSSAEPVPRDVSATYFEDSVALFKRLRELMDYALASGEVNHRQTVHLVDLCFATILEATVHDHSLWQFFKADSSPRQIVRTLILENSNPTVREATKTSIKSVYTALDSLGRPEAKEFGTFFWNLVVSLVPDALQFRSNAEQFFVLALEIFRQLDDESKAVLPLSSYVKEWSKLLFEYHHEEHVGQSSIDWVISGLAGLLQWCMLSMKGGETALQAGEHAVEAIFRNHLFPDIVGQEVAESSDKLKIPVLDSTTRGRLYTVILSMVNDLQGVSKILNLTGTLLSDGGDSYAWSWGLAQITDEYTTYDPNWSFDRYKYIRSNTGYAGMKNLSNTCYMNSLITQLFMNVHFREFMLHVNVSDAQGSQKLLFETQRLFAFLQETWLKAVDPESVAAALVTYEGTPIDVSIQMDVDEFYNLLFDRWESQILSDTDKRRFRQFYGGQIVQQIKSKDCEHVSERLEPFSAIQCEIQGKQSLAESLNAYVEGEVMEGDNKYSCSSCGKYVNAVKRACFKDIPDNLIFHLKRFDYDVMGGTRNKINDYFEFPSEIDMAAYNVAYLQDTNTTPTSDKFTLVGVLVHTGTAEAGHYYSYIRERPGSEAWVEFNDTDVSYFDAATLPGTCFGGWQEPYYGNAMSFPKAWNAYMLFYQRSNTMTAEPMAPKHDKFRRTRAVELPLELATSLRDQNETWIRKFCMFDNEHGKFIKGLLEKYRRISGDECTDDHLVERNLLHISLQHIEQIFARQKDCAELFNIVDVIGRIAERCPECCKIMLQWIITRPLVLRSLLLRCPLEKMRSKTKMMLFRALKYLRDNDPVYYGIESDVSSNDSKSSDSNEKSANVTGAFVHTVKALADMLPIIHNFSKAWEDYYGLLTDLASLGSFERATLHDQGFLLNCLQVLIVLSYKPCTKNWPHMAAFARLSERRSFALNGLIILLHLLLRGATMDDDDSEDENDPADEPGQYRLTAEEARVVMLTTPPQLDKQPRVLLFLEEILSVTGEETAACEEIVRTLTRGATSSAAQRDIYNTVMNGTRVEPASSAKSYLCGTLAFCETCMEPSMAKQAIMVYARDTNCIGTSGGPEYLEFFVKARVLWNEIFSTHKPAFFKNVILQAVPLFAPVLLYYTQFEVRQDTVKLLYSLVFDNDTSRMDDMQEAETIERVGKKLGIACLEHVETITRHRGRLDCHRVEELKQVLSHCIDEYFAPEDPDIVDPDSEFRARAEVAFDNINAMATSSPEEALSAVEYDSEEGLTDYSNQPEAS